MTKDNDLDHNSAYLFNTHFLFLFTRLMDSLILPVNCAHTATAAAAAAATAGMAKWSWDELEHSVWEIYLRKIIFFFSVFIVADHYNGN